MGQGFKETALHRTNKEKFDANYEDIVWGDLKNKKNSDDDNWEYLDTTDEENFKSCFNQFDIIRVVDIFSKYYGEYGYLLKCDDNIYDVVIYKKNIMINLKRENMLFVSGDINANLEARDHMLKAHVMPIAINQYTMQQIKLYPQVYDKIFSDKKRSTLRLGIKDFKLGNCVLCQVKDNQTSKYIHGFITSLSLVEFQNLNDSHALSEGYASINELKKVITDIYDIVKFDQIFTLIKFNL